MKLDKIFIIALCAIVIIGLFVGATMLLTKPERVILSANGQDYSCAKLIEEGQPIDCHLVSDPNVGGGRE